MCCVCVCRDTRNALLSPTRLRIPTVSGPSYTIYSCLGFFFYRYYSFIITILFFFSTTVRVYYERQYDDKTIDVFRKKKL